MSPLIERHRPALRELARRRGASSLRIFGSAARGEEDASSAVGFLVTLDPGVSALALGGLLLDFEQLLGRRVDMLTEGALHPAMRLHVLAEAQPV